MLLKKHVKKFFTFALLNIAFFVTGMEKIESLYNQKYVVLFDINTAFYCHADNKDSTKYLKSISQKTIKKDPDLSFIQKPYQSEEHDASLSAPLLNEYDVEIIQGSTIKFAPLYAFHISCKGKVTIDFLNEHSNPDNTFLGQAIDAMVREYKQDMHFTYSSNKNALQNSHISPLQEDLKNTIVKELTYVGKNQPRSDLHINLLRRYFPKTLARFPTITLGKCLYLKILNNGMLGNLPSLPITSLRDTKVICEKYDITVYTGEHS